MGFSRADDGQSPQTLTYQKQPMNIESNILHETENLYLFQARETLEIRLNGQSHAVLVGKAKTVEAAKQTMARLERYPRNLRAFLHHE